MTPRKFVLIAGSLCFLSFIFVNWFNKKENNIPSTSVAVTRDFHVSVTTDTKLLKNLNQRQLVENNLTDPVMEKSSFCRSKAFLVIVIASAPKNYHQRNAIRSSWGSAFSAKNLHQQTQNVLQRFISSSVVVKITFLLGRARDSEVQTLVEIEADRQGDIVFGDFLEDYRNLTMKTRLGLKWAYYQCSPRYFLKTDDDVFLNTQYLVEWLVSRPSVKFYTGWCNFGSRPVRQLGHKWYVSTEDFPGSSYPGYCLGGGYLMSGDVLAGVVKLTYGRKHFPMEDLYVGIMVNEIGDIQPIVDITKFNLIYSGESSLCDFNKLLLAHPVESRRLAEMTLKSDLARRTCT